MVPCMQPVLAGWCLVGTAWQATQVHGHGSIVELSYERCVREEQVLDLLAALAVCCVA